MTIIFDGTSGIAGSGSVTGMTVANTAISGTITGSQLASSAQYTGMKNRIINGTMAFDQRLNGSSTTNVSGATTYTLDRWNYYASQASKFTIQQNSGNAPLDKGFNQCVKITSTSAYTVGAGDVFTYQQGIEGWNISDWGWGTSSAKTVTLSFWVYSSLTGTFGGSFYNNAGNRCFPFSYTINSANTWEQKSVVVTGDTTGSWASTTTAGVWVEFSLGMGSNYLATPGSWYASSKYSATGATNIVSTSGATWYLTGVQVEVGSVATSYDVRSYGTELNLCQRYYERSYDIGQSTGSFTGGARGTSTNGTVFAEGPGWFFLVAKRTAPTVVFYNLVSGASAKAYQVSSAASITVGARYIGTTGITIIDYTSSGGQNSYYIHYTADAEL